MARPHWVEAGMAFVVTLSAAAVLIPGLVDAEVDAASLLDEHRRVTLSKEKAAYIEDYTLSGFRDFQVRGDVHPLLLEYRRDLLACGLSGDALLRFEVIVDDSGDRSHSHIEAEGADDACLRDAFALVPFEGLAPPTGTLVASGLARGAELAGAPAVWQNSDMTQSRILAVKNGESWKVPGGKGRDRFLASQTIASVHEMLDCSDAHDVVWVDAVRMHYSRRSEPVWAIETVPSTPCVEDAVRERWEDLLAAAFGGRVEGPGMFRLSFNIIHGYPEAR